MKHRAVKCQWKLSSSLFLLLSILLFSVFSKEEPLMFSALLVFSEQAALLLLTKFLLSPQNKKRPFFPRRGSYLDIAKTTPSFKVPQPSLAGDPRAVWACDSQHSGGCCPHCSAWGQDRALLQLSGGREPGLTLPQRASHGMDADVLVHWSEQCSHPEPLLLLEGAAPAPGAVPTAPCPRAVPIAPCPRLK